MWELAGDLGYHKEEEESTEDWHENTRWLSMSTTCTQCLVYQINQIREENMVCGWLKIRKE